MRPRAVVVRSLGLIYGLVGLGALLGLLHILVAIGMSLARGEAISGDAGLALLMVGSVDGLVALFGFLVMYGFFTLRRWARYTLMATGLLGLGFGLFEAFERVVLGSLQLPMAGLGLTVGFSGLAYVLSITPVVRNAMNG